MAQAGKRQLSGIVSMLIGFRQSTERRVQEDGVSYETDRGGADDFLRSRETQRVPTRDRQQTVVRPAGAGEDAER